MLGKTSSSSLYVASNNVPYFPVRLPFPKNAPTTISEFFKKTNLVIQKLGIGNDGYKVISNSGINGGQEVPHFHIHILGGQKVNLSN